MHASHLPAQFCGIDGAFGTLLHLNISGLLQLDYGRLLRWHRGAMLLQWRTCGTIFSLQLVSVRRFLVKEITCYRIELAIHAHILLEGTHLVPLHLHLHLSHIAREHFMQLLVSLLELRILGPQVT